MNAKAACLLLSLAWSGASAELPPVEQSVESMTDAMNVPTASGALAVRSCLGCPERYLTLTAQSQFFIGDAPVSFTEFQKVANQPQAQPLVVHYRAEDNTITRIVLSPRD